MIVTPLVGSLVLFWMVDAEGIIGANLQILMSDPYLSVKSSKTLTWITLIIYGIWHHSPFAFVVFYAALQTVPQEPLEASIIDGASRFQRVKHIVLPHIYPVVTFVALISLMDNFRVFEPIIGFSAQGSAQSLSWLIYDNLVNEEVILFGSADEVADKIMEFREEVGDFGTLLYAGHDWADVDLAKKSMELMAEKVMPRINQNINIAAE